MEGRALVRGKAALSDEWEIDNLPNRLTVFRMTLIPIILLCLLPGLDHWPWGKSFTVELSWVASFAFLVAGATDFFDGHIARKRGLVTVFGSFLDPVADKFLVVSSLILLLALGRSDALIVVILVLREMYILSLRLLAVERGFSLPVGRLGKWKTGLQMGGIPLLMAHQAPLDLPLHLAGSVLLYFAAFFGLYSALEYSLGLVKKMKAKRRHLKNERK